jgi:hypothetical protein
MPPNFLKAITGFMGGTYSLAEPRQGSAPIKSPGSASRALQGDNERSRQRAFGLPPRYIRELALNDDIIVAIRRSIRMAIGDMEWKIVPDVARQKADLKAWQQFTELNLAMPGLNMQFHPQAIDPIFFTRASGALRELLQDEDASDEDEGGDGTLKNNTRLREFFDNCLLVHSARAERNAEKVRAFFDHPEPDDESVTFRDFSDQIIDSLTLWDCAPIVKNPDKAGMSLYETYLLPGDEIHLYRRADRKRPMPPNKAFEWRINDQVRAYYNALEMTYITANRQPDGYGKPPVESLFNQIMASLYGDAYMLEFFANNNAPRGVFDLGPNVSQEDRDAVEERWNGLVKAGQRRIIFVSNSENVKGYIPVPEATNRDSEVMAAFEMWAKRKCAVFGLNLGDIGFTENLHRSTAEDQSEKSQSRGINSLARVIAGGLNTGIIKSHFWVRDDPLDPNNLNGTAKPVFPFTDVKFEWVLGDDNDGKDEETGIAAMLSAGVLTINEVRKDQGKPPLPGGDVATISGAGLIKVADLKELPAPQPPQPPGAAGALPGGDPNAPPGTPKPGGPPGAPPHAPGPPKQNALPSKAGEANLEKIAKSLAAIVDGTPPTKE